MKKNEKILIIFSHPRKNSFNSFILSRILHILQEYNLDFVVRDLYEIGFDPVLKFEENLHDIMIEQNYIRDSNLLIFIYPVWWGSMPAILKGYIDRVFSYGFAYTVDSEGKSIPLLSGKKSIIVSTLGGEEKTYKDHSLEEAIKKINKHIIFEFCGIELIEQFFIYGVKENNRKELEEKVEKLEQKIREIIYSLYSH